jgi:hypothetical protein
MAITTLSGGISGIQPLPKVLSKTPTGGVAAGWYTTLWGFSGVPAAGAYDTTLNGVALSSPVTGQIPFTNPASGNAYLARITANNSNGGTLVLCDRLWHNGGYTITSTSAQNSTTPTWPARDVAGATSGDGVFLALEVSAGTGSAAPTVTISYTNSAGTSGRTATQYRATATSGTGITYLINLQAGDTGVRSVQSLTLSASWVSGTINLVAYREIARFELISNNVPNTLDLVGACMPRMYAGSVPYFMWSDLASPATNIQAELQYTWG